MKITGRKSKYEVGDVVVVEFKGEKYLAEIRYVGNYNEHYKWAYSVNFIDICHNTDFVYHKDILGLAEITDNETKNNDGWIMVDSDLPDASKPIFFVFETGIVLLGYLSEVSGNFIAYTVPNLYLAYQPKQIIKWQYVKFPKI